MATWRVLACDPFTDEDRGELPVKALRPSVEHNGPGSLTFTLEPKVAGQVPLEWVEEANSVLYVQRDGATFAGTPPYFVWDLEPQGQSLKVSAAGLDSILDSWYDRKGHSFSWDAGPIATLRTLIAEQQQLPGGNVRLVVNNATSPAHIGDDETREGEDAKAFVLNPFDSPSYGDLLRRWSDLNNGFDYACWAQGQADGSRLRRLDFYYPRRGRHSSALRWSTDTNIVTVPAPRRSGHYRSQDVMVLGAGTGKDMIRARRQRVTGKPLIQTMLTQKGMTTNTMADRAAKAELVARSTSQSLDKVTIKDHPAARLGSVYPGDDVYIDASYGWTDFHGWCRIQAVDYLPGGGENGQDLADVSLARADQFVYGPDPNLAGE